MDLRGGLMRTRLIPLFLTLGMFRAALSQSPGTFTAAGDMTTRRFGHTANLLTTGMVLITGGEADDHSAIATAELYDPTMRTFAPTGDMTRPRLAHTSTLLPSGKVLITGGGSYWGLGAAALANAELYDPATGTFAATGDMTTARCYHTATLLNSGKVLIAGGQTTIANGLLASAELYDPSTGTFSPTGDMTTSRDLQTATRLADGKVLIVGFAGAELYDPNTGTFSLTSRTIYDQFSDTATLLPNGKVLITFGDSSFGSVSFSDIAQLYDPSTGVFSFTGKMAVPRGDSYTATLLSDGTVLIAGVTTPTAPSNAELYDPNTGTFKNTGDMAHNRQSHAATLLTDGAVLMSGGWTFQGALASAEIYHPAVLIPAPVLLSLSGDGKGQGAIQHAGTYEVVSPENPALAGEALIIYCTGLADGSMIPPQVAIGGRMAEVLWFGNTPGFAGLNQINVRVPSGVTPDTAVSVRLNYIGRSSNEVTIAVQ
jgi:hypothetical protein